MIPTFVLVSVVVFLCIRFIPGDTVDLMVSEAGRELEIDLAAVKENIREALGLNVPIHIQYWHWMSGILLHGDLGDSLWTNRAITEHISDRLPVSVELGSIALITACLIGVPVGVFSAMRQDTWHDYVGRTIAILCICLATMVVVYPSIWWGWSPAIEYIPFTEDPSGNIVQFMIPGAIVGMVMSGTTMRMTRTMMLEVLRQDYIRTAWSKGVKESVVILRHAMKNALIPVVTIVGLQLPVVIGGTVIVEEIFALPGLGRLLIQALNRRDYPMVSGITVLLSSFVLVINLGIDLTYAYIDPRVQYR